MTATTDAVLIRRGEHTAPFRAHTTTSGQGTGKRKSPRATRHTRHCCALVRLRTRAQLSLALAGISDSASLPLGYLELNGEAADFLLILHG